MIQCSKLSTCIDKESLLDYLREDLDLSRSQIKKYFSSKQLSSSIKRGQEISIPFDLINRGMINPNYYGPDIQILYEDEKIIAVSKPVGVHSHPHGYDETDNILSYFRMNNIFSVLNTNTEGMDRGLLYRLDRGTSGVLLFAKSDDLYHEVRNQFDSVAKKKIYQTIVCGKADSLKELSGFLIGTGKKGSVMKSCASDSIGAMKAQLRYRLIEYKEELDLSLLEVELQTGVRHQIRAQLANEGLPILGDTLYGGRNSSRIFLHAYLYELKTCEVDLSVCSNWNSWEQIS